MSENADAQQAIVSARAREHLESAGEDAEAPADAGLFADGDVRDAVAYLDAVAPAFADSDRREVIRRRQATKFVNVAVEEGNVSAMQHVTGYVDNTEGTNDGVARLMPYLSQDAFIGAVTAPPENGKTNLSLWIADMWALLHDGVILTNVPMKGDPDHVEEVTSESELYVELKALDRPALVVLDEFATNDGREGRTAKNLEKMVREIRKDPWRASIILIGHGDTDLTRPIRQMVKVHVYKPTQTTAEIYEGFDEGHSDGEYKFKMDVPKCRLDYPEYENPQFEFDAGDEEDDGLTEEQQRQIKINTAVELRKRGLTQSEVADEVGRDRSWVSRYVDPRLEAHADADA